MSEENIKDKCSETAADSAVFSPEERLAGVQLYVTGKSKNCLKAMAEIKTDNGKKFARIRARIAENTKTAESKTRERMEEISSQRKEAYAEFEQKADPVSSENSEADAKIDLTASAEAAPTETDKKEEQDELTIQLGGSILDYGEKCVIRVGAPPASPYIFSVPYAQPVGQAADGTSVFIQNGASVNTPGTVPVNSANVAAGNGQNAATVSNQNVSAASNANTEVYTEAEYPNYPEFYGERETVYEEVYPDSDPERFSTENGVPPSEEGSPEYEAEQIEEEEHRILYESGELRGTGKNEAYIYELVQLNKAIAAFHKEEGVCARKIQKIEEQQKDADTEQNVALIVEKIALQKEMCELAVETLGACVYVSAKGKMARHEKLLRTHIDRYNRYCEEYEKCTGRPLHRLDYGMIEDTLSGRISRPIPNVYYYGAEGEAVYNSSDEEHDRLNRTENEYAVINREYERYLEDGGRIEPTPAERRAIEKQNAERLSAIRHATERDLLLIALRNEYRLESLEARRDILVNSYTSGKGRVMKELRTTERSMNKVRAAARRSISVEREDNTRFYLLSALDPKNEKIRDGARRDRLASLRQRLDLLLSEREIINEQLIVLYGGSDKKLKKAKVNRKAAAVRRKSARRNFKKQGDLARKIERFNVSSAMKEKAYTLLNQKTAAVAKADEILYKIKHLKPHGRARGELYSEFKRARKEIKRTNSEIRYMLRRLKKIQDRNSDRREFTLLFVLIAIFVAAVGSVWLAFGDEIVEYFKELIGKLRGL